MPDSISNDRLLMKHKKIVAGGIIGILLCVGVLLYYNYISTPKYVISHLLQAYAAKNESEFEKYMDVDDFSYMLWSDYKEWRANDSGNIWAPIRNDIDSADALKITIRNVVSGKKTFIDLDKIEKNNSETVSMAHILDKLHDYKIISESDG